jgi:hypothetical protein
MIDFARIEDSWRSPANGLTDLEHAHLARQFARTLNKRRFLSRVVMGSAALALAAGLAFILYGLASGRTRIDWPSEWAVVSLFAVPCIVLALAWRAHMSFLRPGYTGGQMLASLRALLDENASGRFRLKLVAGTYCLLIPLLIWGIRQLGEVGKMQPVHQQQAGIALGAMLAVCAGLMAVRFYAHLKPEQRRLEALIRQYDRDESQGPIGA